LAGRIVIKKRRGGGGRRWGDRTIAELASEFGVHPERDLQLEEAAAGRGGERESHRWSTTDFAMEQSDCEF
jgi:hypothetical protein